MVASKDRTIVPTTTANNNNKSLLNFECLACCSPLETTFDTIEKWSTSKIRDKIYDSFPGAITDEQFCSMIKGNLQRYNFGETSLVATSLCSDEVNRPLEKIIANLYGSYYSMGGLAGVSFGGVTAFTSMTQNIPDGGSCLVVYGPHVGIDSNCTIGRFCRRGQKKGGACCGPAIAAIEYVKSVKAGKTKQALTPPEEVMDVEQAYVGNMLLPYAERLQRSNSLMVDLPHAMFEAQDELMNKILKIGCQQIEGDGKLAIVGGIHINTPSGMPDFFLPLRFDVVNNKFQIIEKVLAGPCPASAVIVKHFPRALPLGDLVSRSKSALKSFGYGSSTLLCTSLCCDEVNRPLEEAFQFVYGDNYNIGGLAGFPFGGSTGFSAMAQHIPDGGSCLILYGPHVGIDSEGMIGSTDRQRGRHCSVPCCGPAIAALNYVETCSEHHTDDDEFSIEPLDAQQVFVEKMLLAKSNRILNSNNNKMIELPLVLYDAQDELMNKIITKSCHNVPSGVRIALLGGIQINTPSSMPDYFLPRRFEIRNNNGILIQNFMSVRN